MNKQTPEWVKNAVFYQIFPDRFARSPRTRHRKGVQFMPWGSPPEKQGYQGGDLRGIVDKLDYLQDLGINALYLNPIFSSAANHRYHTYDYFSVDPLLGGDDALRELLQEAHARHIRVVLDGVFNHTGRGFWPFHHILENGGNSPYIDWFTVHDWPLRPYNHDADNHHNYAGWWDMAALPKLNTRNPGVREYLMQVARYWIDFGIDGWRLDVPAEIDDDSFWQEFRRIVKEANPEAYIVGEIWSDARRWCQGDQFDAVMNYLFTVPTLNFFAAKTLRLDYERENYDLRPFKARKFRKAIQKVLDLYDWEINLAQMNLLDSHDTARALWVMGEDKSALRLAVLFQMTMPGAPCIYYGDEIGLSAADDPFCREAFPWNKLQSWDTELLTFYKQAIALRHRYPVLRTGSYEALYARKRVFAFRRALGDSEALVIFNTAVSPKTAKIKWLCKHQKSLQLVWPSAGEQAFTATEGILKISIPAQSAVVLLAEP
ncbi:MAG: glycoside hydrolase family 13 protein [Candidatus Promineifilaceae bacterium]|nr:glycoside hydrolase family 13 protein [Candidatus Promineifilaceae bacterium]